jgi:hypothetical protein
MKIPIERPCDCGGTYVFSAYGDEDFKDATCSRCGSSASLIDPLSVSVTGERLLIRSETELRNGDYSLSIVIGVLAVESFLTRLFLKLKGMESYAVTYQPPTAVQEAEWEKEITKSGGFPSPAGFVSQRLVGTTFDDFVATNKKANVTFSDLPDSAGTSPAQYFQDQLFKRRNRIAHWGYVNSNKSEAQLCHAVSVAIVTILREMDAVTDWVGLAQEMAEDARSRLARDRKRLKEILAAGKQQTDTKEASSNNR